MILQYNLQYFAKEGPGGEKTEPATDKKLKDARKKGQVAKSKEIANGLGLLSLFLVLKFWVGSLGTSLIEVFSGIYVKIPDSVKMEGAMVPVATLESLLKYSMIRIILIAAPVYIVGFCVSFISDVVQVKWQPTLETMKPKFEKLNPISGFKKIFSKNSIFELIKSLLKIGLVLYVSYKYLIGEEDKIYLLYDIPLKQAIVLIGDLVTSLGIRISAIYMVIALADFAYQKWKFMDDMKMTKQEIRDEYKDQEGDPQIKGKQRQRMQEASRRRMMQELPKADVVITNPTHYAVAIKYDAEVSDAPIVVAKGADYLAQKIKEVARENKVEIVENKPLARMLYANVDIGSMVPPELYQAVAEVLAFVYHLKGKV